MKSDKDHREFMALLGRCERTVFKVCMMFTDRSWEGVRDLYQDIVSELWVGYSRFRSESAERTWVYRVAINTAVRGARRERRRLPTTVLDEATHSLLVQQTDNELVDRLYDLIYRLEPQDREWVLLYLDGVPQREVARIMRCSERTVRNRMKSIIQLLIEMNENED